MTNRDSILIGNRLPRTFFETTGTGESDITIHAGSYHLALRDAGIEMANIMTYSSILPATARLVSEKGYIAHGSVMETISAIAHAEQYQRATAAIIYAWLHDHSGHRYGGLVCEYSGNMIEPDVRWHLRDMLFELYHNGYDHLYMGKPRFLVSTFTPTKRYGTAVAALCFTDYIVPVLHAENAECTEQQTADGEG